MILFLGLRQGCHHIKGVSSVHAEADDHQDDNEGEEEGRAVPEAVNAITLTPAQM